MANSVRYKFGVVLFSLLGVSCTSLPGRHWSDSSSASRLEANLDTREGSQASECKALRTKFLGCSWHEPRVTHDGGDGGGWKKSLSQLETGPQLY